jgi:hypothetical protein
MAASHLAVAAAHGAPGLRRDDLVASLLLSLARHRIARASALEGDFSAIDPCNGAQNRRLPAADRRADSWAHRRERAALDRMSPSFAPNIAAAEDFDPAGAGKLFSRNRTLPDCRERDRVLFVATIARLCA